MECILYEIKQIGRDGWFVVSLVYLVSVVCDGRRRRRRTQGQEEVWKTWRKSVSGKRKPALKLNMIKQD